MNQPSLKKMIENECANNESFRKGRNLVLVMALLYVITRFSDLIVPSLLTGTPYELSIGVIIGLLTAVCVGYLAVLGSVKLVGVFCLLTPIANTYMMFSAAKGYQGGFMEMMRSAPTAWYVLAISVICAVIGIILLINKNIDTFGKRRKELQKGYAYLLKEFSYIYENERVKDELHDKSEEISEPVMEINSDFDLSHQDDYDDAMDEFKGESSTLRAFSIPSAISKVNKKRVFDLHRDLVCKKYKCKEKEVDEETYILTFAGNKKTLMKWIPEEKRIYIESDTNQYDEAFHVLMLDVINYLSKNMGSKFEIIDLKQK